MTADRRPLYQKRDRLRQLQAFCRAAKLGSMTRAAEELLISQPAVSLHVRELEHELEAVLFERNGPRIALSPAGERLYELAVPFVEGMDGLAEELARELDHLSSDELRVASGDAGAHRILPGALKRLRQDFRGTRFHLRLCVLEEGLELLRAEDAELYLGSKGPISEEFEYHPILSYDLVLITALDHPLAGRDSVTREEIAAGPVIVPDSGSYSLQSGESPLRSLDIETRAAIEVEGWELIERYVETGLGVAVCPSFTVPDGNRVSVVPLEQYFGKRSYGWFTRRAKPLSRPARRLLAAMDAEVPDRAHAGVRPGDRLDSPSRLEP